MKIAILGLGFMGSTHVKAWRAAPGAELFAVCDSDARRVSGDFTGIQGNLGGPGERFDFSGIKQYRELNAALADPEIAAVDLCLPTYLHEAATIDALRAGKHVLVEKPMALDGPSARRMIAAAEASGRILMTAQVIRFFPEYTALRNAVRGGQWGRVRHAIFRRRCATPAWGGWLKDPARSGGGAFDLLIHDVDFCLHLLGKPVAISATGYLDPVAGPDCINGQLFYPEGVVAAVGGGWQHPGAYPFGMEYTVTLDAATIEYNSNGRTPTLYAAEGGERVLQLEPGDGYALEIEYFVACCRTGKAPERCPPQESADAVEVMRMLLAARERNGEKMECRL